MGWVFQGFKYIYIILYIYIWICAVVAVDGQKIKPWTFPSTPAKFQNCFLLPRVETSGQKKSILHHAHTVWYWHLGVGGVIPITCPGFKYFVHLRYVRCSTVTKDKYLISYMFTVSFRFFWQIKSWFWKSKLQAEILCSCFQPRLSALMDWLPWRNGGSSVCSAIPSWEILVHLPAHLARSGAFFCNPCSQVWWHMFLPSTPRKLPRTRVLILNQRGAHPQVSIYHQEFPWKYMKIQNGLNYGSDLCRKSCTSCYCKD